MKAEKWIQVQTLLKTEVTDLLHCPIYSVSVRHFYEHKSDLLSFTFFINVMYNNERLTSNL